MFILVAEDDEALRSLLTEFLEGQGHTVKGAKNGMELVELALPVRPDLIITDLNMPEMDGSTMIALLNLYPELSGIPVIVITGTSLVEVAEMRIPKEIQVLIKPFNFTKISAAIEKVTGPRSGN
ncbi:MAG: response regulator [Elusimicrobiota bacterium]|nr:response regulator [Elusimicrobiota bacterium]